MAIQHLVPALLANAEVEFSAQLRMRNTDDRISSRGMSLYRKIVRENTIGVLQSVFPLFCRSLNDADMCDLIDDFLHQHQAKQPEFHQIATELLIFIRQQPDISNKVLALVEYEWLIYAVEIDDVDVPLHNKIKITQGVIDNVALKLNPTLKIISLPFSLMGGEPCYESTRLLHYYVLYRKSNGEIYQKNLNDIDLRILLEINSQEMDFNIMKERLASYFSEGLFIEWIVINSNDELLSLIYKG